MTGGVALSGIELIRESFALAKSEGRCALIPYLCAGDPDRETTRLLLEAVASAGADVIELGIPYGDPLADGPTIAAAAQRALEAGMTIDGAFELIGAATAAGAPPILAFTYLNPVVQYGVARFADALVAAGAAGAIVPDVPLEEISTLRDVFCEHGLALPLLIAPTTPLARAREIVRASGGFVYLVSRLGVTGAARTPDFPWIAERIAQLRSDLDGKPIAVGFGIATSEHVRTIARDADGAIIGSALIDAYTGFRGEAAAEHATAFMQSLNGKFT